MEDIAPNGYLVLQIPGNSTIPSSYEVTVVSGPNIDVVLTDEAGFVEYMNGGLESVSYSIIGTFLDTRHAAFYGDLANGTHYLIIDNTIQGTAQPNGQTARVTYSAGTIDIGILASADSSISILGIILVSVLIFLSAIAGILALAIIGKNPKIKQFPLPFYSRSERDLSNQASSIRSGSNHQKPNHIRVQPKTAVRPILVIAIGRCPMCNGIIAYEWTQCSKCGLTVDRSKLRPFE